MNFKREALNLSGGKAELITIQTNEQNSLTRPTMLELAKILKEIQADDSYKGAILTSENPKFFSNGLDAETLINTPPDELVDAVGGKYYRRSTGVITNRLIKGLNYIRSWVNCYCKCFGGS